MHLLKGKNSIFLTCTIFKFSPSFITITKKCLGMTRPLTITMTIITAFENYGRNSKLDMYNTMLMDLCYFEITYQSNQPRPNQDYRDILRCCKNLCCYNQHPLCIQILWKKKSQLSLVNKIKASFSIQKEVLK